MSKIIKKGMDLFFKRGIKDKIGYARACEEAITKSLKLQLKEIRKIFKKYIDSEEVYDDSHSIKIINRLQQVEKEINDSLSETSVRKGDYKDE